MMDQMFLVAQSPRAETRCDMLALLGVLSRIKYKSYPRRLKGIVEIW